MAYSYGKFVGKYTVRPMDGMDLQISGQIIATSHLTPNGGLVRDIPFFFKEIQVGEIL